MRILTNFNQAELELAHFVRSTMPTTHYTLDTMRQLMEHLGNPQDSLKVIHVAGTSGKTSTAYYITSLLQAAGYTTGLSISPHINHINERAQINLLPLPEKQYCKQLGLFLDLVDASQLQPSHFELMVAFAYWLFNKLSVQYAVIEVGLGGLLDGTNVVNRSDKVCVITDIGLDHVEVLGDTLAKIAFQKAGIIYANNDVFMYEQAPEIMAVLTEVSDKKKATLHIINPQNIDDTSDLPTFQQRNFFLAKNVVAFTLARAGQNSLNDEQTQHASKVHIPGRMDEILYHNKTLVMDGAHNEQKITALVEAMKTRYLGQQMTLLVAFGQNKQSSVRESLKLLRELGSAIIVTQFTKGQDEVRVAIAAKELATLAEEAGFTSVIVEPRPLEALKLLEGSDTKLNLIAGSFYLLENFRGIVV